MTTPLLQGLDSLDQPTQAQAQAFFNQGYTWWAFNVWGLPPVGSAAGIWNPSTASMLKRIGFRLLPIGVPRLNMTGDPRADANAALNAASAYGVSGLIACDTENVSEGNPRLQGYLDEWHAEIVALGGVDPIYKGAHYTPSGAPTWLPFWVGSTPPGILPIGVGAWQWSGGTTINGVNVDRNVADPSFPLYPPGTLPVPPTPPTPVKPKPLPQKDEIMFIAINNVDKVTMSIITCDGHRIILGAAQKDDVPTLLALWRPENPVPEPLSPATLSLFPQVS